MTDFVGALLQRLQYLESSVEKLHRGLNNVLREVTVEDVFDDGTAIVSAHGAKTKRVPWLTMAGSTNDWVPPTPGERMLLVSPGGHVGRGMLLPGGYTDDNPQPRNKLGQAFRKVGASSDLMTSGGRKIKAGLIILDGDVIIKGRLQTDQGIHDGGGVYSDVGVYPLKPTAVPTVNGDVD